MKYDNKGHLRRVKGLRPAPLKQKTISNPFVIDIGMIKVNDE